MSGVLGRAAAGAGPGMSPRSFLTGVVLSAHISLSLGKWFRGQKTRGNFMGRNVQRPLEPP